MATLDDILGNDGGGGTPAPKGSLEWQEQQSGGGSSTPPTKGSAEWAEQHSGDNAPSTGTPVTPAGTQTPQVQKPAPAGTTEEPAPMSYADLYKKLNPYTPPTQEQLEKEKKKQKRDQIFAAIGDGISALSNLYFTTQYAPNMYTGKDTMSERTRVRYDKLMKDREANQRAYSSGLFQAMMADDRKNEADREWQRKLGLDEYQQKRDEAKDKRDQQLFDLNIQLQSQKISAAEADARRKQIEADYADELNKAKVDTEHARAGSYKASAGASNARAKYYNNGGSGGGKPGEYPWYDADGKKHYAHSYEAMRQNAIDAGTWNEEEETSTTETRSGRGKTVKTSETTRNGKGHSSKPTGNDNTPPSRRDNSNDDNTPPSRRK